MLAASTANGKPILSLDFDGVLHDYTTPWCGAACIPDGPVPGAIDFLLDAIDHFEVHIFSSRSELSGGRLAMQRAILTWAEDEGVPIDRWHRLIEELHFPAHKPLAAVGLDDRVLTFTGTFPAMSELAGFTPWNKRGT